MADKWKKTVHTHLGLVADIALMTKACTALLRLERSGYARVNCVTG